MTKFSSRLKCALKLRAVRLGILACFVFTFIGLPTLGQWLGTNAFESFDVLGVAEQEVHEPDTHTQEDYSSHSEMEPALEPVHEMDESHKDEADHYDDQSVQGVQDTTMDGITDTTMDGMHEDDHEDYDDKEEEKYEHHDEWQDWDQDPDKWEDHDQWEDWDDMSITDTTMDGYHDDEPKEDDHIWDDRHEITDTTMDGITDTTMDGYHHDGQHPQDEFIHDDAYSYYPGQDDMKDMFEDHFGGFFDDFEDKFDYLTEHIDGDAASAMTHYMDNDMMEDMFHHMDNEHAQDMLTTMAEQMDVWGDRGTELMEHTTEFLNFMDDIDLRMDEMDYHMQEMWEHSQSTMISASTEAEFKQIWGEMAERIEKGEDIEDLRIKVEELMGQNEHALVFEDKVAFMDVPVGEDWYYDDVMGAREQGILDGDPDGYFHPTESVNYAELAKMMAEAAGLGMHHDVHPDLEDKWFGGYAAQLEHQGVDVDQIDWSADADRGTIAVWAVMLFEMDMEEYDGEFDDVDAHDPHADHYATAANYGLFTQEEMDAMDDANRAEVAKILMSAMEQIAALQMQKEVAEANVVTQLFKNLFGSLMHLN